MLCTKTFGTAIPHSGQRVVVRPSNEYPHPGQTDLGIGTISLASRRSNNQIGTEGTMNARPKDRTPLDQYNSRLSRLWSTQYERKIVLVISRYTAV